MSPRSHARFVPLVVAALAFGVLGANAPKASAESRPSVVSTKTSADLKSKDRVRVSRAHRRTAPKHAAPVTQPVETSTNPVFLSDAWLKQEKETDDKLKRFMTICKGC